MSASAECGHAVALGYVREVPIPVMGTFRPTQWWTYLLPTPGDQRGADAGS
jgi:hypothetical protein